MSGATSAARRRFAAPNNPRNRDLPTRDATDRTMIFQEPPATNYDLRFRVFDVPVRVHPMFWIVGMLLGTGPQTPPWVVLSWVCIVFVSILVHELGHVLAFRYYGARSHIVLHGFGGLAVSDSYGRRDPMSQLMISLAGPAAGFVFAAVVVLGLKAGGIDVFLRFGFPDLVDWRLLGIRSEKAYVLLNQLLHVNIYWGLVNLLPIYPLDGGQAARSLMELGKAPDALRNSLLLSVGTAVLMALFSLRSESTMLVVFFGYMAFNSYQMLQALGGRYRSPWQ